MVSTTDSTPLAQRLIDKADDAMFDPQGIRPRLGGKQGRARAAVVAVLRELNTDQSAEELRLLAAHRAGLNRLADSIEKGASDGQ